MQERVRICDIAKELGLSTAIVSNVIHGKTNKVSDETVLLYGTSKAERRAVVSKDHKIVLLLGDTLHDFDGVFRKAPTDVKRAEVDKNAAHFGADWIVFPNATYGDWSTAPLTAWDAELVVK